MQLTELVVKTLFYEYDTDDLPTPDSERDEMISFIDISEESGVEVLITDYCSKKSYVDDSYTQNAARGYISFASDNQELNNIPFYPKEPSNENSNNITTLSEATNFLYLINPGSFPDINAFLDSV